MKAKDFLKKMQNNPEFTQAQKEKEHAQEKQLLEIRQLEKLFLEDLKENGYSEIDNSSELLKLKALDENLMELVLKWIPLLNNKYHSQEMLVRGLAVAEKSFDGDVLIKLFDKGDSSESLKWAIANTIASANVKNITEWLENKVTGYKQPKENEMLVYAVIKYFPYIESARILKNLYKNFPLQVIDAFTYIGTEADLSFLESSNLNQKKEVQIATENAIKKIKEKVK